MVLRMQLKNLAEKCFKGELTMPKVTLWMIGIICVLAGIVYGLCAAPLTHGIAIGSNNRNYDKCMWEYGKDNEEDEEA